jgi:hypothetical protein
MHQAIEASRALSLQQSSHNSYLESILALSRQTAVAEEEEAQALNLAIEASLGDKEQKSLALGFSASESFDAMRCAAKASQSLVSEVDLSYINATFLEDDEHCCAPANGFDFIESIVECSSEFTAVESLLPKHILKVSCGSDTRRLRGEWDHGAPSRQILASIRAVISESFGLESNAPYVVKYCDDEGDLCTLVDDTVVDFLELHNGQNHFKLVLEHQPHEIPAIDTQKEFSIATPPSTPRRATTAWTYPAAAAVEDDCDAWSLVDIEA